MTGKQAVLQLRMVTAVLKQERMHGRSPEGLPERATMLIDQAARSLDGSDAGVGALAQAKRELALAWPASPEGHRPMVPADPTAS